MIKPFIIAHISDLHLSAEYRRQNIRRTKHLLDYLCETEVDHLVITGDIAADARPEEFAIARRLLMSRGLFDAQRTTIIPGNHDIFGGVHAAEDILDFPSRCRNTDLRESMQRFSENFAELLSGCQFGKVGDMYPFVKEVGPVSFIGLNSVVPYSVVQNPFGSNGSVPDDDLVAVKRLLAGSTRSPRTRIALIHHHFHTALPSGKGVLSGVWGTLEQQTMKLRGKKKLVDFFRKEGIDLVLHGHYHTNMAYVRHGIRFANMGGSVMGLAPGEPSVNVLRISEEGVSMEIQGIPQRQPVFGVAGREKQARPAVSAGFSGQGRKRSLKYSATAPTMTEPIAATTESGRPTAASV